MPWLKWPTEEPTKRRWKQRCAKEKKFLLSKEDARSAKILHLTRNGRGDYYELKQVMPVIADEADRLVVITVYVFYFGGNP